jgi:hypothetical protein
MNEHEWRHLRFWGEPTHGRHHIPLSHDQAHHEGKGKL